MLSLRAKCPSIGGVAACRRGGKRVRIYPLTLLSFPHPGSPQIRPYVCVGGIMREFYILSAIIFVIPAQAGIRSIKFISRIAGE